jgi:hypothetical protein
MFFEHNVKHGYFPASSETGWTTMIIVPGGKSLPA